jgi:hypothetical protein
VDDNTFASSAPIHLRRSSLVSKIALEYLQEFIYYAYTFYMALLERDTFKDYRVGWIKTGEARN